MANDELNLDELFQGLPHGDRICELYGNSCTCGRDEEILKIKSALFTHVAHLLKIKAVAIKIKDWVGRQKMIMTRHANETRFDTIREAAFADAENFHKMEQELEAALNESEPK